MINALFSLEVVSIMYVCIGIFCAIVAVDETDKFYCYLYLIVSAVCLGIGIFFALLFIANLLTPASIDLRWI